MPAGLDPLQALLRLRRLEVLAARRQLAERIGEEADAVQRHEAAAAAVTAEATAAGEGEALASFGAWVRRGIAERERAAAAMTIAGQQTEAAREAVAMARAAERAVEIAIERVEEEEQILAGRKAQSALDEAGSIRPDEEAASD